MESLLDYVCQHANHAHIIIFSLLLLAGFNIPISEDLMLLTGGVIGSRCIPDQVLHLYLWIFFGCWVSAWEAYWLGRLLGPKLYDIKWFKRFINPARIEKLHSYYEKFGVFTFIVGRFVPGGVRNALFMSTGLGKMPFWKFILRDGFACLISSSTLFYLGYFFGTNYTLLFKYFKTYELVILSLMIFIFALTLSVFYYRKFYKTMVP